MKIKKFVLMVLLVGLIFAISGCGREKGSKKVYHYMSKNFVLSYPLKSLELNYDTTASFRSAFTIGFGKLNTNTYYYVYEGTGDGNERYILKKYDVEKTYIAETSGQPRFEKAIRYVVVDKNADNFTVDGNKAIDNGFLGSFTVGDVRYITGENLFNDNYDVVSQHVKVGKNQRLYVSLEDAIPTLYVPQGTIKVKFNADVNNIK